MNIVIIPARGGSKGIPKKNIRLIAGKPLIAWSIEPALKVELINRVVVSTDCDEIAAISKKYGAEVVKRPMDLATDTASSESSLLHCMDQLQIENLEYVVFRQCTSPFVYPEDIEKAIIHTRKNNYDSVFSAYEEHFMGRWQYINGKLSPINYDPEKRPMRQDFPPEIIENGAMYIFKPEVIKNGTRFGKNIGVYLMPRERSFQVDSIEEFNFIENILPFYSNKDKETEITNVKLVILDFDGTMTDNTTIVSQDGIESVRCNRSDGLGIRMMRDSGLEVVCITSETNRVVKTRCDKLRIEVVSSLDKEKALQKLLNVKNISPEQCVFLGNDLNDIPILQMVKYPAVVNDAHIKAKKVAKIILSKNGGAGAVLELAELLLKEPLV